MIIGGLQKTSLIDFPGRLACTIFTQGCNFACPFCHNKDLVKGKGKGLIDEDYFFDFLEKRRNILEGVCITGGEPCLQTDLVGFCQKIKSFGLEIKLDTNGSRPEVLEELIRGAIHESPVLDMVAIDVKARWEDYEKAVGVKVDLENVKRSMEMIVKSGLEYELRTTVVPKIHNRGSLIQLAKELKELGGKNVVWVLQKFRASENCLDKKYRDMESFSDDEMEEFLKAVKKVLPKTELRGVYNYA